MKSAQARTPSAQLDTGSLEATSDQPSPGEISRRSFLKMTAIGEAVDWGRRYDVPVNLELLQVV